MEIEIEIDGTIYNDENVKQWASELDVNEDELFADLKTWDDRDWVLFHHLGGYSSRIDRVCELKDDYLVLTDDEADSKVLEYMEDLVDDDCPDYLRSYVDVESLARDSSRAQTLAIYDGIEYEYSINGRNIYYVYRVC